jgi:two-component system sensor histidine kinase/response regulator
MNQDSTSATINRYNELLALMEGDHDLLRELVAVFLEDAPRRLAAVRAAVAALDASALYKAAHALKGSAGNFGAAEVVSRALQLEAHARSGDLASASLDVALLEADMNRLTGELADVCRK